MKPTSAARVSRVYMDKGSPTQKKRVNLGIGGALSKYSFPKSKSLFSQFSRFRRKICATKCPNVRTAGSLKAKKNEHKYKQNTNRSTQIQK